LGGRSPSPVFWLRHCVHGDDAYRWAVVITSRRRLRAVAGMTTTCCSNSSMPRTALMKSALSSTDRAPGDAPWRPGTTLYRARAPPAGWFYRSLLLGRLRRLHRGDFNQRNQSLVAREVFTTFCGHPSNTSRAKDEAPVGQRRLWSSWATAGCIKSNLFADASPICNSSSAVLTNCSASDMPLISRSTPCVCRLRIHNCTHIITVIVH